MFRWVQACFQALIRKTRILYRRSFARNHVRLTVYAVLATHFGCIGLCPMFLSEREWIQQSSNKLLWTCELGEFTQGYAWKVYGLGSILRYRAAQCLLFGSYHCNCTDKSLQCLIFALVNMWSFLYLWIKWNLYNIDMEDYVRAEHYPSLVKFWMRRKIV